MRQNANEDEDVLELSKGAPRESTKLIPRLVIRESGVTGERAKALLNGVGINISLMSANMLVADAKRMLRILDQRGLLCDDFEGRRSHASSDFVRITRKKRRTA